MTSKVLYKRLEDIKIHILKNRPKAEHERQRMCAVILDKHGYPISFGDNSYTKSHTIMTSFSKLGIRNGESKIFLHCEIDAMNKGKLKEKQWHTLIIARLNPNLKFRMAKPCEGCSYMIHGKFTNIFYTNNDGELVLMKEQDFEQKSRFNFI